MTKPRTPRGKTATAPREALAAAPEPTPMPTPTVAPGPCRPCYGTGFTPSTVRQCEFCAGAGVV